MSAALEFLQHPPGSWSYVLGALALIATALSTVMIARFKYRGSDYLRAQNEALLQLRQQDRADMIAAHEQQRLDRAFDAELGFFAQIAGRMKSEIDAQLTTVPAASAKPVPAQVEKAA